MATGLEKNLKDWLYKIESTYRGNIGPDEAWDSPSFYTLQRLMRRPSPCPPMEQSSEGYRYQECYWDELEIILYNDGYLIIDGLNLDDYDVVYDDDEDFFPLWKEREDQWIQCEREFRYRHFDYEAKIHLKERNYGDQITTIICKYEPRFLDLDKLVKIDNFTCELTEVMELKIIL